LALSTPSKDVVRQLVRGHASIQSLADACGGRFSREELATFVASLRTFGLFHSGVE
jgi:hypothetical protein